MLNDIFCVIDWLYFFDSVVDWIGDVVDVDSRVFILRMMICVGNLLWLCCDVCV